MNNNNELFEMIEYFIEVYELCYLEAKQRAEALIKKQSAKPKTISDLKTKKPTGILIYYKNGDEGYTCTIRYNLDKGGKFIDKMSVWHFNSFSEVQTLYKYLNELGDVKRMENAVL